MDLSRLEQRLPAVKKVEEGRRWEGRKSKKEVSLVSTDFSGVSPLFQEGKFNQRVLGLAFASRGSSFRRHCVERVDRE
jgi:hypothetical protein